MKKEIDLGFMKQGRIAVNCKTRSDFYALCMAIGISILNTKIHLWRGQQVGSINATMKVWR